MYTTEYLLVLFKKSEFFFVLSLYGIFWLLIFFSCLLYVHGQWKIKFCRIKLVIEVFFWLIIFVLFHRIGIFFLLYFFHSFQYISCTFLLPNLKWVKCYIQSTIFLYIIASVKSNKKLCGNLTNFLLSIDMKKKKHVLITIWELLQYKKRREIESADITELVKKGRNCHATSFLYWANYCFTTFLFFCVDPFLQYKGVQFWMYWSF